MIRPDKTQSTSGKAFCGQLELRSTCTRMTGSRNGKEKGLEQLMIHTTSSVKHGGGSVMHERAWLPVTLGYWCLVMT